MKRFLKGLLFLVLAVVLLAGAYIAYLVLDYSRLPDQQELVPAAQVQGALPVGEEQTIVTWNIGFGAYSPDFSFFMDGGTQSRASSEEACRANVQGVLEILHGLDADLMLIQEVDEDADRSHHVNQRMMLEEDFRDDYSSVFAQNYDSGFLFYPFSEPHGASRSGIVTLADAQIDGANRISLPVEGGIMKFLDLDRCYSVSRIPVENGKELCLYNLHLSAYTSDGSIATQQLELLLQDMQAQYAAGNYVIAGGDFNKDLWGDSAAVTGIRLKDAAWAQPLPVELLPEGFVLADSLNPEKPVLSCRNADIPYEKGVSFEITLDGFVVSDNVQILSCDVVDSGFAFSDHNPVVMHFKLV